MRVASALRSIDPCPEFALDLLWYSRIICRNLLVNYTGVSIPFHRLFHRGNPILSALPQRIPLSSDLPQRDPYIMCLCKGVPIYLSFHTGIPVLSVFHKGVAILNVCSRRDSYNECLFTEGSPSWMAVHKGIRFRPSWDRLVLPYWWLWLCDSNRSQYERNTSFGYFVDVAGCITSIARLSSVGSQLNASKLESMLALQCYSPPL